MMKSLLLTTLVLLGMSPAAFAEHGEEDNLFTRTLRGVGAFFGGSQASAEADIYTRGRFSSEETALIREVLEARARARVRAEDYDDDDHDYDHDEDDDDEGRKPKKHKKGGYAGGKKPKKLPPGLRKKLERGGELPPGWQKKFERGEVVSDDVWAQRQALPNTLLSDIEQVPGTEVIQVGDRVARVLTDTREILDIIDLVTGP